MTGPNPSPPPHPWPPDHRQLLDSLNIGFALMDLDDQILEVNETLVRMAGWSREAVVGQKASRFYGPEEYEHLRRIGFSRRKEAFFQFESFLLTADGSRVPVLFNSSINKDAQGQPVSFSILITDIRAQKAAQAELESANQALSTGRDTLAREKGLLEAILFGIGDCVTVFDQERNILLCNPQGREIRSGRRTPLLPLVGGLEREIEIEVRGEARRFLGRVEAVKDPRGQVYAFAEILKEVTHQVRLAEKERELTHIRREIRRRDLGREIVGVGRAMSRVFELILRCAEVDATILLLGETGVGKELVARAIHTQSSRKERPFVAVNCGALPEALLESELFGHVKGAFTGAISDQAGLFREAQGGVLFLDEIGDLGPPLQIKLLRALQEKEVRPVGGGRAQAVDVRVMAATNRDLLELVHQGRFRSDLYYRIAVIPVEVPPLRVRPEDIGPLVEHFLAKHGRTGKPRPALDRSAWRLLRAYDWPGNVRELENSIEHALALVRGPEITAADLPIQMTRPPAVGRGAEFRFAGSTRSPAGEKEVIRAALERHQGHRGKTARALGISRSTLWRKMTMLGLTG
ncbi:MAG: sigma 54-interacting transcriptional regulator [Thermodesulfobacteriota bacterium]